MKLSLLLVLTLLPLSGQAITLAEGIAKCNSFTKEERTNSPLCKKVSAKLKENKLKAEAQKKAVQKKPLTTEQLKVVRDKCQKLTPPKQYKYKICHQFMSVSNDPFLGKEQDRSPQYSLYTGYSFLGNINGFDLEVERRTKVWGVGVFYSQHKISDVNGNEVSGSAYGASFKYHFTPLSFSSRSNPDVAGFVQLGLTNYSSPTQSDIPNYFYVNMGIEGSIPLTKINGMELRGYGKLGIGHIYHSESDFLNIGSTGVIGLKFDF